MLIVFSSQCNKEKWQRLFSFIRTDSATEVYICKAKVVGFLSWLRAKPWRREQKLPTTSTNGGRRWSQHRWRTNVHEGEETLRRELGRHDEGGASYGRAMCSSWRGRRKIRMKKIVRNSGNVLPQKVITSAPQLNRSNTTLLPRLLL